MKTKTFVLSFLFLFVSFAIIAQETEKEIDIHTFQQRKTENTDPSKNKTITFVSGVRKGEVCNITVISTRQGIQQLKINEKEIPSENWETYSGLIHYIHDYANGTKSTTPVKVVPTTKPTEVAASKKQTNINDRIVAQLKADNYIKAGDKVYDFMLSNHALFFNGKRLPDPIFKKYYQLYKDLTGMTIGPTAYYHIQQSLSDH